MVSLPVTSDSHGKMYFVPENVPIRRSERHHIWPHPPPTNDSKAQSKRCHSEIALWAYATTVIDLTITHLLDEGFRTGAYQSLARSESLPSNFKNSI